MPDLELRADFDHDGRLTSSQPEHDARTTAPGAIIVANADADRRALPTAVTAGPAITLDHDRYTPPAADDEVLPLSLTVTNAAALAGRTVGLRVSDGIQTVRIRFYDATGRIIPPTSDRTPGEHPLTLGGAPALDLRLEARAYPGSPLGHATTLSTTFDPATDTVDESAFELTAFSRDAAGNEVVHDSGRFSVAPILFLDNGVRAVRVYMADRPDNLASVTDVRVALRGITGVSLVTVAPSISTDTWLQDQFQPGIVVGADGWRHAIVHLPRLRSDFVGLSNPNNLAAFVTSHFPARNVGLMNDFWNREIAFSDAVGHLQRLRFRDAGALWTAMHRVFATIDMLDAIGGLVDRTWTRHADLSWSQARELLEPLLDDVRARISAAARSVAGEARTALDAMTVDAQALVQAVVAAFPRGTATDSLTLPLGSTTADVDSDRADELYTRIWQLQSSANYGGNVESAPPTPDAPLGKIVLGNSRIRGAVDHMDPDVQRFLHEQRQPVVEIDTSWLDVGHVDEVLTFVPDRHGESQTFAALRASAGLAMEMLRAVAARYRSGLPANHPQQAGTYRPSGVIHRLTNAGTNPVTRLMRGKLWSQLHPRPQGGTVPDILDPPRIYQALSWWLNGGDGSSGLNVHDIHYLPGGGGDRFYPADITVLELLFVETDTADVSVNDFVETTFLVPLDDFVDREFHGARRFPLPVVFDRVARTAEWEYDRWAFSTSAFTPDLVNMQVLNGHLLVPRPYGPRMRPADVTAVLTEVLQAYDFGRSLVARLNPAFYRRAGLDVTTVWIRRQDAVYQTLPGGLIRALFNGLRTADDVAQAFRDGFPGVADAEVKRRIVADNARNFDPSGDLRDGWRKFVIHEHTVDVFEAYVALVAAELGVELDWVDSWFYHVILGGLHCGTNVLREPDARALPQWWRV